MIVRTGVQNEIGRLGRRRIDKVQILDDRPVPLRSQQEHAPPSSVHQRSGGDCSARRTASPLVKMSV